MGEAEVRQWLQQLVLGLPVQHIQSRGLPYLDRYFLAGWRPGVPDRMPALYLHHFLASDPSDEVHSHPWEAFSLLLVGGYRDHRCVGLGDAEHTSCRDFWAGDVNHIQPTDRHRVELLTPDVWTLLVRGPLVQDWTFSPACPP